MARALNLPFLPLLALLPLLSFFLLARTCFSLHGIFKRLAFILLSAKILARLVRNIIKMAVPDLLRGRVTGTRRGFDMEPGEDGTVKHLAVVARPAQMTVAGRVALVEDLTRTRIHVLRSGLTEHERAAFRALVALRRALLLGEPGPVPQAPSARRIANARMLGVGVGRTGGENRSEEET